MKLNKAYIIDDEEAICLLLSAILKRERIKTNYSTNILGALEGVERFQPDIVFLDLSLKDGSGFSIIPDLRRVVPNVSIVIISAHSGESELNQAKELKISHFLPKPLNRELILDTLNEIF